MMFVREEKGRTKHYRARERVLQDKGKPGILTCGMSLEACDSVSTRQETSKGGGRERREEGGGLAGGGRRR
jgi:hypothetical protein